MDIDLNNGGIISPSVMCADLLNLENDIKLMKSNGIDFLHVDFMDNKFVPNITFGTDVVRALKNANGMRRDIHIMALEPQQYFDVMDIGEGDIVSFHTNSCKNTNDVHNVLYNIRSRGAHPSIAISPDIDTAIIHDYINEIDAVLIMTVYPGFAGRPMAQNGFDHIRSARKIIDDSKKDILLEVDGNVSWENAPKMRKCGADMFVAGSSSIFGKGSSLTENIARFNSLIK